MRASIVLLATLLLTTTAHAQQVGIVVTGEATMQPQLAAQLERWLRDHGRPVVPGPLEPEAINTLIDCFVLEDMTCARGVVDRRSKSKVVVFARAEVTPNPDGTRDVGITGYWFQKGKEVIAERRVCRRCTDESLRATVDELMLALVHEVPLPAEDAPKPPPLKKADEGDDHDHEPEDTRRLPRYLPHALIGGGGLAFVVGGILIAIDQDPDPAGPQQPTYRDSATGGVVLGLAGAAAIGAGVYLWMRERPSSAPVATVTRDGGFIGWTGRF